MKRTGFWITITLILAANLSLGYTFHYFNHHYYHKGEILLRLGDWKNALQEWEKGKAILDTQFRSDPRIASNYIGTVIANRSVKNYEMAVEMYLWAFSGENINKFSEYLYHEATQLLKILEGNDAHTLGRLIDRKDLSTIDFILCYWMSVDPTPKSKYNEKLIQFLENRNK